MKKLIQIVTALAVLVSAAASAATIEMQTAWCVRSAPKV